MKTGRIQEVFGFEPADISVRAGRLDLMVRDDAGKVFHIEEQRIQEGRTLSKLEERRELVIDALIERFSAVSSRLLEQIKAMQSPEALKVLFRQALKCKNIQEFESVMQQL